MPVEPLKQSLRDIARAICKTHGYKGVVIMALEEDDISGGTWNASPHEMREMGCVLISASYTVSKEDESFSDDE